MFSREEEWPALRANRSPRQTSRAPATAAPRGNALAFVSPPHPVPPPPPRGPQGSPSRLQTSAEQPDRAPSDPLRTIREIVAQSLPRLPPALVELTVQAALLGPRSLTIPGAPSWTDTSESDRKLEAAARVRQVARGPVRIAAPDAARVAGDFLALRQRAIVDLAAHVALAFRDLWLQGDRAALHDCALAGPDALALLLCNDPSVAKPAGGAPASEPARTSASRSAKPEPLMHAPTAELNVTERIWSILESMAPRDRAPALPRVGDADTFGLKLEPALVDLGRHELRASADSGAELDAGTSWTRGLMAADVALREVSMTNVSDGPLVICGLGAFPGRADHLCVVDEHRVARGGAVSLPPGATYRATVALRRTHPHPDTAGGFFRVLLVALVAATPEAVRAGLDRAGPPGSLDRARLEAATSLPFFLASSEVVYALLPARTAPAQLDPEARPFQPARNVTLFDQPAQQVCCAPLRMLWPLQTTPSAAAFARGALISLIEQPEEEVRDADGSDVRLQRRVCTLPSPCAAQPAIVCTHALVEAARGHTSRCREFGERICEYERLLGVEDGAARQQLRLLDLHEHDLWIVAVPQRDTIPQILSAPVSVPFEVRNAAKDFSSDAWPKTYRGPRLHVVADVPSVEKLKDSHKTFYLGLVTVPGLQEKQPDLFYGYPVRMRLTLAPDYEFECFVASPQADACFIVIPPAFFTSEALVRHFRAPEVAANMPTPKATTPLGSVKHGVLRELHSRPHWGALPIKVSLRLATDPTPMLRTIRGMRQVMSPSSDIVPLPLAHPDGSAAGNASMAKLAEEKVREVLDVADSMEQLGKFRTSDGKKVALNRQQKLSVAAVASGACGNVPFCLWGPPGTGKTLTIAETALQILARHPDAKILLCATAENFSADLLCAALLSSDVPATDILRLNDPRWPSGRTGGLLKQIRACSIVDEASGMYGLPAMEDVLRRRVVVSTCLTAGLLHDLLVLEFGALDAAPAGYLRPFTHLLVDEAGQATVPETLLPMSMLRAGGTAMLVGDPRQLGPVIKSPLARSRGLSTSLLELFMGDAASSDGVMAAARSVNRLAALDPESAMREAAASAAALAAAYPEVLQLARPPVLTLGMLEDNYRSHESLLTIPNRLFYQGRLQAVSDQAAVAAPEWQVPGADAESTCRASLVYVAVRGHQRRAKEGPSYFNDMEVDMVRELVQRALSAAAAGDADGGKAPVAFTVDDIGVVATYREQVYRIRLALRQVGLGGVAVGTVADFQGQEKTCVIVSTVLSRPESLPSSSPFAQLRSQGRRARSSVVDGGGAFWGNPSRFNVAVTRARALLVVVGHPLVLVEDPCWREVLAEAARRRAWYGGDEEVARSLGGDAAGGGEESREVWLEAALLGAGGGAGSATGSEDTLEDWDGIYAAVEEFRSLM